MVSREDEAFSVDLFVVGLMPTRVSVSDTQEALSVSSVIYRRSCFARPMTLFRMSLAAPENRCLLLCRFSGSAFVVCPHTFLCVAFTTIGSPEATDSHERDGLLDWESLHIKFGDGMRGFSLRKGIRSLVSLMINVKVRCGKLGGHREERIESLYGRQRGRSHACIKTSFLGLLIETITGYF